MNSLVSGGCIVSGAGLRDSLLFTGVKVHSYAVLDGAVIQPYADIGRHARLSRVVIDRGVRIPEGLVVGEDPELDAERFRRTDKGTVLITQPMIDRLGGLTGERRLAGCDLGAFPLVTAASQLAGGGQHLGAEAVLE